MNSKFVKIARPGFSIAATVTQAGTDGVFSGIHYHTALEFHVVDSGELTVCLQDGDLRVGPGQTCLIEPNVYHYLKGAASRFELRADPEPYAGVGATYAPLLSSSASVYDAPQNFALLRRAYEELAARRTGYREAAGACIELVLVSAARAAGAAEYADSADIRTGYDDREKIIADFFSDNYALPLRAPQLASKLSISVRQLDRLLKGTLGLSFKQALVKTRMEAAKDMLRRTQLPVERIAELVGYAAESNFYRAFKAFTGVTPGEYRQSSPSLQNRTSNSENRPDR